MTNREQIINDLMYECFFVASKNFKRSHKTLIIYSNGSLNEYDKFLLSIRNLKKNISDSTNLLEKLFDNVIKISGRVPYKNELETLRLVYSDINSSASSIHNYFNVNFEDLITNPRNIENNKKAYDELIIVIKKASKCNNLLNIFIMDPKSYQKKEDFLKLKKNLEIILRKLVIDSIKIKKFI